MCDFMSWIEKDGKLYFLRDDDIESHFPDKVFKDCIGHSSIEIVYPESKDGSHCESAVNVPKEIAVEINRGHMDKMARAGGWSGARYDKRGNINSPWWKKVEKLIKEVKTIKWLDNHGKIKKEWKLFDTYDAAYYAAYYAANSAARNAAYSAADSAADFAARNAADSAARSAAYSAADSAARNAAGYAAYYAAVSASLLARCFVAELPEDSPHMIYAKELFEIWRRGYGTIGDVDGMFYVFRRF